MTPYPSEKPGQAHYVVFDVPVLTVLTKETEKGIHLTKGVSHTEYPGVRISDV